MEAVEIINVVDIESVHHGGANGIGRFIFAGRRLRRERRRGNKFDRCLLQRGGKLPIDDSGSGQQAGELLHLFLQRRALIDQKRRRRAHRYQERQGMLESAHFVRGQAGVFSALTTPASSIPNQAKSPSPRP